MSVVVTTTIKASFKPWIAPNFVNGADGITQIAVKDADQNVLDAMAAKWLKNLYDKAGKRNPWQRRIYR